MTGPYPHWVMGVFYYHPEDPRLVVPIRNGRDHIFNYAKPLASILTGASVFLPVLGGGLMIASFIRFFDQVMTQFFLILIPTAVVLACVASVLGSLFIRDEDALTTPHPGAVQAPWDRNKS